MNDFKNLLPDYHIYMHVKLVQCSIKDDFASLREHANFNHFET